MKCINMKIVEIIFFIVNFVIIHTSVLRPNKATHNGYEVSGETSRNKFEQNCSQLWNIMSEHNLIDYVTQCKEPVAKSQITKEDVLLHSCFVIQNMISVACDSEINETSLDLLGRDKLNNICPFNFTHLEHLESIFKNHEAVKHLTNKENCDTVCYDVYTTEVPCILLNKFNNYLRTQMTVVQPKANVSTGHPPNSSLTSHNYERTGASQTTQEKSTLGQTKPVEDSSKVGVESPVSQLSKVVEQFTKTARKENKTEKSVNVTPQKDELKSSKKEGQVPTEGQKPNRKPELLPEKPIMSDKKEAILSEKAKSDKKTQSTEDIKASDKAEQKTLEEPKKLSDIEQRMSSERPNPSSKSDITNVDMKVSDLDGDGLNPLLDDLGGDTSIEGNPPDEISLDRTSSNQGMEMQKKPDFLDKEDSALTQKESYIGEGFTQAEDSHFFFYFIMVSSVIVVGYLAFHNKNKILAYALEGSNGRRSRRRPNPARYRKLESNLEEAMSSSATNAATSSVVY